MKNRILIFGFVILSTYSYGQFAFGLKGGININEFGFSDSSYGGAYKPNNAFHLGLFGQLKLKEKLIFIPELQFTQRGANLNSDIRINLNYIELPVLISYKVIKQLNIELGPTFAYKISTVVKGTSLSFDDSYNKNFDIGVASGIRFFVSEKISIIGRYYYGISSVEEFTTHPANANQAIEISTYNRTIQLGVGYKLK